MARDHGRRHHPFNRILLLGLIALAVVWMAALIPGDRLIGATGLVLSAAAQGRSLPPPPAAPVQIFRPDLATCQPQNLVAAHRRHLEQFASQPPEVLVRLRQLQLEMGEATLRSCAGQNLISREEAERIWRDLQLMPMPQAPSADDSQRP
jgi:hypothetical protein